jgi:hypothetical protein
MARIQDHNMVGSMLREWLEIEIALFLGLELGLV